MNTHPKTEMTINPEKREILVTRVFNAPRDMVFQIYTDPKLLPQWWGPRNLTTYVDKMDLRPGGGWRFVQHDADGNEFAFNGVFSEIVPPERVVSTFEFEGMPGHELVETMILEEYEGKTKMIVTDVFQTVEDLYGMVQSGMEGGMNESYERLDDLLAVVQKEAR